MNPMLLRATAITVLSLTLIAQAQQLTPADYARAESMLSSATTPLLDHTITGVHWKDANTLLYTESTDGKQKHYTLNITTNKRHTEDKQEPRPNATLSPDGKTTLFIRDWNLWVHDTLSGKDRQLTTDGVQDFGYATDNAGWKHTNDAVVLWSPDSKRIATFQQDQRKTGEMYLVSTNVGHPHLEQWKYPFAGDKDVTMIERVVIDAATGKVTRLHFPPDQHRGSLCDDLRCTDDGPWEDVEWSADSKQLAFLSTSRDHKDEHLYVANADTGEVRSVLTEHVPTYYESGNGKVNWHYLFKTDEVLWFSERDNWGQLYLYDGKTGKLKNKITTGEGNVTQVLHVDEDTRTIIFQAVGREQNTNPYYTRLYSIHFDGSGLRLITPENANHTIALAPDAQHFVDTWSTVTEPPVTVLRDIHGKMVTELARTSMDRLKAAGWVAPEPFTVKARDGRTDLYGILYKPSHFDATKKYPLITYVYPGPMGSSVKSYGFAASTGDHQALAELGFVVLTVNGMGTEFRSKSFHDFYYGNMGDNTLPDQIAAAKQLAARYPWIDLTRAGIWGHSGGGYATADAMFRYPDFYKVGIAESGNHDNRNYEDDWAEKWIGLLKGDNYESQANESIAKNLKGHLLLIHGTGDDNVPPENTLLVVDALIKANKDFDLIMVPNAHHAYGAASPYIMRRRWDYFVRYLLGAEPPHEYQMKPYTPMKK
ncbi:MAG: DPP IV N-terminal domain-containing protein [Acidobacteria bacterium]|nr:DPP IV N-terminal domain-containing protein [Acidobacteriota bacterium]